MVRLGAINGSDAAIELPTSAQARRETTDQQCPATQVAEKELPENNLVNTYS